MFTTAVYISPDVNASTAIRVLHGSISKQLTMYPDAVLIVACGPESSAP